MDSINTISTHINTTEGETLIKQKQYIESILKAIPDIMFIMSAEGIFLEMHSGKDEDLIMPKELFLGKKIQDVMPDYLTKLMMVGISKIIFREDSYPIHYQLKVTNDVKDFEARFTPFGQDKVIVIVRDITLQKKAERELVKTKNLLEQAGDLAKIGAFEYDFLTKALYWSPIIREIHEVPSDFETDIESAINFYKAGEDRDTIRRTVEMALKEGKSYDFERKIITAKGNERWVRTVGMVEFANNEPHRLYGSLQDISSKKKVEEELIRLLETTKGQNERLKNFAHIVSHNLRTHSGNIKSLLELFFEDNPALHKTELAQLMVKASDNLWQTIENLTEVALSNTTETKEIELISVHDAIKKAMENVSALSLKSQIKILNETSVEDKIFGIPSYFDSILLNFLTNAIKYSDNKKESYVRIFKETNNNFYVLCIEDNGLGIDIEKHGKSIFGLFNTFHNHSDSRGVGLFITKNQIESMGGSIKVESKVGVGTTFKVYFKQTK